MAIIIVTIYIIFQNNLESLKVSFKHLAAKKEDYRYKCYWLGRNKRSSFFSFPSQLKNATFWLDEMAKKWFLQTHKISWIRGSYKNPAEGTEMAPERAWKISARDWKWTKSPQDWHGLQLAEELPEPSSLHSGYWAKAARSSMLTNPALPNRNCSQQVILFSNFEYFIISKMILLHNPSVYLALTFLPK